MDGLVLWNGGIQSCIMLLDRYMQRVCGSCSFQVARQAIDLQTRLTHNKTTSHTTLKNI